MMCRRWAAAVCAHARRAAAVHVQTRKTAATVHVHTRMMGVAWGYISRATSKAATGVTS